MSYLHAAENNEQRARNIENEPLKDSVAANTGNTWKLASMRTVLVSGSGTQPSGACTLLCISGVSVRRSALNEMRSPLP